MNPNVLICSVGTEIFYRTAEGGLVPDQSWEAHLDKGWDRAAVEAEAAKYPQLKPQVCWYVCVWAGLLFVLSYWGAPRLVGQTLPNTTFCTLIMCCHQVASEQRRHKLSYHLTRATPKQDAAVLQVGRAADG